MNNSNTTKHQPVTLTAASVDARHIIGPVNTFIPTSPIVRSKVAGIHEGLGRKVYDKPAVFNKEVKAPLYIIAKPGGKRQLTEQSVHEFAKQLASLHIEEGHEKDQSTLPSCFKSAGAKSVKKVRFCELFEV